MKTILALVALFTVLMIGCNNKEDQLREQLSDTQNEAASLQQGVAERDKYFEDVMRSVNEVYMDLEKARIKEGHSSPTPRHAKNCCTISATLAQP